MFHAPLLPRFLTCSVMGFAATMLLATSPAATQAGTPQVIHSWNMDVDPGWERTGEWEHGQPLGGGGVSFGLPDPVGGHTGYNALGMNHAGDYSIEIGGPWYVVTDAIDCSNIVGTELRFHRWLNIDWEPWVFSYIHVSNDGIYWTELWRVGPQGEIVEDEWSLQTYDISAIADGHDTVYIKWSYEVAAQAWAYSGWNIDDVEIRGTEIVNCDADTNGDAQVDVSDVLAIIDAWGYCPGCPEDVDDNGWVTVNDLLMVIDGWGPCSP
ncbi:MAG: hypothetical protein MK116_06325 [Phycisphaerales bacterium]|nr:hypothetical protein [Phycisphaerales bacterium]